MFPFDTPRKYPKTRDFFYVFKGHRKRIMVWWNEVRKLLNGCVVILSDQLKCFFRFFSRKVEIIVLTTGETFKRTLQRKQRSTRLLNHLDLLPWSLSKDKANVVIITVRTSCIFDVEYLTTFMVNETWCGRLILLVGYLKISDGFSNLLFLVTTDIVLEYV